jgi:hypothetical protein
MSNRKVLPFSLVLLFIFTSLSPIVNAFDWDDDGIDDSIDSDDDNDSVLDIDDQCTPGQVNSYSLGMRDHDSDGCDDHLMFVSNAFLEGDDTDAILDLLFDSNDNQIIAGYSLGNYSKFQNYNITTDPNHAGYSFVSKIDSSGNIDWLIYTFNDYYARIALADDDSIYLSSNLDTNLTWYTPTGNWNLVDTNNFTDPYVMKISNQGDIEWIEHNENFGDQIFEGIAIGEQNNAILSIFNYNGSTLSYGSQTFSLNSIEGFVVNVSSNGDWGSDIISIESPAPVVNGGAIFDFISNTDNGYMAIVSYQDSPIMNIKKNGITQCSISKNNSQITFEILSVTVFHNWNCKDTISVEAHYGYSEAWINDIIIDHNSTSNNLSIAVSGAMEADTYNYSTLEFGNWGIITPFGEYTLDGHKAFYGEIYLETNNSSSSLDWDYLMWDNSYNYVSEFTDMTYSEHSFVLCGNFFSILNLVDNNSASYILNLYSISNYDYDSFCLFLYDGGSSQVVGSLGYIYQQFGFYNNDILTAIDLDNTGRASIAIASTSTFVTFNNTNITTNGSSYDTHLFNVLFEEDFDDDNDGIEDYYDQCPLGEINWDANNNSLDLDWDGCKDSTEDDDDDNDGLEDSLDSCPRGETNWSSWSYYEDYDSDGCRDFSEDLDDDDDGILDINDLCQAPYSELNWYSDSINDYDGDGCLDITEDYDDDNDGVSDTYDNCPVGLLNWTSGDPTTDWDGDGCQDTVEDDDDDNDQRNDDDDTCPKGELNWNSQSSLLDFDMDGCKDGIEDWDDDNDGVYNTNDDCNPGEMSWVSSNQTDYDSDGCRDLTEDLDDDNDNKEDVVDDCMLGEIGWFSQSSTDYDSDGCRDLTEDLDDDNDGIEDIQDLCPLGEIGWVSTEINDYDRDGCKDAQEDNDHDNDGVMNTNDNCKKGDTNWISNSTSDYDLDGCRDSTEDLDDDSDGVPDILDACQLGLSYWYSNSDTDYDSDGCFDQEESLSSLPWELTEDLDDDNDGALDIYDDCKEGTLGWSQSSSVDHDMDGCFDNDEDIDDDNDGMIDLNDDCKRGVINWTSSQSNDYDSDGCHDSSEDEDDDNDLLSDLSDSCPVGELGWISFQSSDYDNDGCKDSTEDLDDDNDGVLDIDDLCPTGELGWTSNSENDFDGDGCQDSSEDDDDDNDLIKDNLDSCVNGESVMSINWISDSSSDHDSDGCNDELEDQDDDNDGMEDGKDQCPVGDLGWTSTPETDFDDDGCQDSGEDYDDDSDGVIDSQDMFPLNPDESFDSDGDGIGNNEDAFPNDSSETVDTDGDGVGDNTDLFPSTSWLGSGSSFTIIAIILISAIGAIVVFRMRKNNTPIPEEQTKSFKQQEEFFEDISNDALSLAGMAPIITETQQLENNLPPSNDLVGEIDGDGYEWIEHPTDSDIWYWRGSESNDWALYDE